MQPDFATLKEAPNQPDFGSLQPAQSTQSPTQPPQSFSDQIWGDLANTTHGSAGQTLVPGSTLGSNLKSLPGQVLGAGKAAANFITSGTGQDVAAAIGGNSAAGQQQKLATQDSQYVSTILGLRNKAKASGQDTTHWDNLIRSYHPINNPNQTLQDMYPALGKSNEQVVGDFAGLAANIISAGSLETGVKGATAPARGFVQGAIQGAKSGAGAGAIVGGVQGLSGGLKANKDVGGVIGDTALGTAGGAIAGGVTGGLIGGLTAEPKLSSQDINQAIQNHLTSAKMIQDNTPGIDQQALIADTKKNLVMGLKAEGMVNESKAINSLDPSKYSSLPEFSKAVEDTLSNPPTPETGIKASVSDAQTNAWKDIQPKATDKTIQAYRAKGNTNPKGNLKGVTLNPSKADTKVLEQLTPLYEDGTIDAKMPTETKLSIIEGKSRSFASQADQLVADNNQIVESPEVQAVLDKAKEGSKVIFGTDKTIESAYTAPQQAFLDRLDSGKAGATGTDTVSLRDALKSWDAEMKSKFPSLWKSAATGEISPTDNARLSGIMDTHTAIRDLIQQKLGPNVPYTDTLAQSSSLIKAAKMMNEGASNLSKVDSFIRLVSKHPYFAGFAAWESLKHTVAPGLPGL